ncbi:hypothetical protein I317_04522 [Kwoniella heveanensis CBS 569]|nr:hypothetical protein I317_04522 [Kwoniella heveanensis CBS 569]
MSAADIARMFRSPSPGEDSDEDDENFLQDSSFNAIARALDLDLRADAAEYKETPFTIAAQRKNISTDSNINNDPYRSGTTRSGIKMAVDRSRPPPKEPTPPPPVKPPIRRPVDRPGRFKPPPLSRFKNKASSANQSQAHPRTQKARSKATAVLVNPSFRPRNANNSTNDLASDKRNSGWVDNLGNPIPKDAPRSKGIVDVADEITKEEEKKRKRAAANAKRKETMRRNKEAKKAREAAEKISFGRLPADSAPNQDFPIVLGLEKQKYLPTKAESAASKRKGRGKEKTVASNIDTESKNHLTQEEVDVLFVTDGPSKKKPRTSSEETLAQPKDGGLLAELAKLDIFHEYEERLQSITREKENISSSQPSTLTHLDSSALIYIDDAAQQASSPGALPYSSPLAIARHQLKSDEPLQPRPRRHGENLIGTDEIVQLQEFAEREETSKRMPSPAQLWTPASSIRSNEAQAATSRKKAKVKYDKYRIKDPTASSAYDSQGETPEWTSFAPKKRNTTKTYNADKYDGPKRCPDKFSTPQNLFPRKPPPLELYEIDSDPDDCTDSTLAKKTLSRPKLTLFHPTSPPANRKPESGYTVVTNRGSRYGATASRANYDVETRLIDIPKPTEHTNSRTTAQRSGRFAAYPHPGGNVGGPLTYAPILSANVHSPLDFLEAQVDDDDDDWEREWMKPDVAN